MKVAAVALALAFASSGCASSGSELEVSTATLRPGQIALGLRNGSEEAARVAQVILNDAFVDFRAPRRVLEPGTSETITVSYPWIAGESYDIELMTRSGATVGYEIEEAS
ncbi:MAG: hypothetical protein ACJ743_07355 [Gaiellaceae bacterium]